MKNKKMILDVPSNGDDFCEVWKEHGRFLLRDLYGARAISKEEALEIVYNFLKRGSCEFPFTLDDPESLEEALDRIYEENSRLRQYGLDVKIDNDFAVEAWEFFESHD